MYNYEIILSVIYQFGRFVLNPIRRQAAETRRLMFSRCVGKLSGKTTLVDDA